MKTKNTDTLAFYTAMSVSNKERVMGDYEQGKRDCENAFRTNTKAKPTRRAMGSNMLRSNNNEGA